MIKNIMDKQKHVYDNDRYSRYGLIAYLLGLVIELFYFITISYQIDINTIEKYNISNLIVIVLITATYGFLSLFANRIDKIFTFVLMLTYTLYFFIGIYIPSFERIMFIILSLSLLVFITYSFADLFLDYNIFKPIKDRYFKDIDNIEKKMLTKLEEFKNDKN